LRVGEIAESGGRLEISQWHNPN